MNGGDYKVTEDWYNLMLVLVVSLFGGTVSAINCKEHICSCACFLGRLATSVFVSFIVYNLLIDAAVSINFRIAAVSIASVNSNALLELLQKKLIDKLKNNCPM